MMLGSALLAAVALWSPAAHASTAPGPTETITGTTASFHDGTSVSQPRDAPYPEGYKNGYSAGDTFVRDHCFYPPNGPQMPDKWTESSYWLGYNDGFSKGYNDNYARRCTAPVV